MLGAVSDTRQVPCLTLTAYRFAALNPLPTALTDSLANWTISMMNQHVPIADLDACQMDRDALDTLSCLFCGNIAFTSFADLLTYFMAGLPEQQEIMEFWKEVDDLGWALKKAPTGWAGVSYLISNFRLTTRGTVRAEKTVANIIPVSLSLSCPRTYSGFAATNSLICSTGFS